MKQPKCNVIWSSTNKPKYVTVFIYNSKNNQKTTSPKLLIIGDMNTDLGFKP